MPAEDIGLLAPLTDTPDPTLSEEDQVGLIIETFPDAREGYTIFHIIRDRATLLERDDCRIFPSPEAAVKHLQSLAKCPAYTDRLFHSQGAHSIPSCIPQGLCLPYSVRYQSYGSKEPYFILTDTPYIPSTIRDVATLTTLLHETGGSLHFTSPYEAKRTAELHKDIVTHVKGSCVLNKRIKAFKKKSKPSIPKANPLTTKEESAVAFNFKAPRHLHLTPLHTLFLTTLHKLLTIPGTYSSTDEEEKWDAIREPWDGSPSTLRTWSTPCKRNLLPYPRMPGHRHNDPSLLEEATLNNSIVKLVIKTLHDLRRPSKSSTYNDESCPKTGDCRTPLTFLQRHRLPQLLTLLSLYEPHLEALLTYPPPCDRISKGLRDDFAKAHCDLHGSLVSLSLALKCRTYPDLPCDSLLKELQS